jgi:hypothetical protein
MTKKPKKTAWTKEHMRELKNHSKAKTPVKKIAKAMKRTEGAVRQKGFALACRLDTSARSHTLQAGRRLLAGVGQGHAH